MNFKESFVITISREVGSGGRTIGRKLAERLDINFFDKELIKILMKRFDLNAETIEEIKGEKQNWLTDFIRLISPMPAASAIIESGICTRVLSRSHHRRHLQGRGGDPPRPGRRRRLRHRRPLRLPRPQGPPQPQEHLHHRRHGQPHQAHNGAAESLGGGSQGHHRKGR